MAGETIRIGLIGAGANTRTRHIPGFLKQPGVAVAAVANRTRASAERVAAEFDIPSARDNWEEIIDDEEIDAVCIGTWPYMHCPVALAALDAGKHVLVEARMAMNSDEAHRMLEAARLNPGLAAQVVPAPHTLAIDRTLIDLIADGYIGDIVAMRVHVATGSAFPDHRAPLHWRHDRGLSGNNIMSMGIWAEAIMRWVGPFSRVQAMAQVVVKHRLDSDATRQAITIPDHVEITGALAAGGVASMTVTTVCGFADEMEIRIHGTEGTLVIVPAPAPARARYRILGGRRGDGDLHEINVPPEKLGGWRVEEEFVNAIRGVEPVTRTSFADGAAYMEFTDAVTRAYLTGESVSLPLQW